MKPGIFMNPDNSARRRYYAHTAEDGEGRRLPPEHWQLLKDHLRQVADLAKRFAGPLGLEKEAELAGRRLQLRVLDVPVVTSRAALTLNL
jgi:hypothetical protein